MKCRLIVVRKIGLVEASPTIYRPAPAKATHFLRLEMLDCVFQAGKIGVYMVEDPVTPVGKGHLPLLDVPPRHGRCLLDEAGLRSLPVRPSLSTGQVSTPTCMKGLVFYSSHQPVQASRRRVRNPRVGSRLDQQRSADLVSEPCSAILSCLYAASGHTLHQRWLSTTQVPLVIVLLRLYRQVDQQEEL